MTDDETLNEKKNIPSRQSILHRERLKAPNQTDNKPTSSKTTIERRQFLEHHLKGSPTDLDSYLELAHLYRQEQRPADAKRVLQQATEVFPDQAEVLWELEEAVLARSLQQYREVLEVAKKLDTPEIIRELERSEDDWACRRIEVCEARISRNPNLHDLRLALGEAMLDTGRYRDACDAVEPLLDQDAFAAGASFLMGRCLLELGNHQEAMKSLRSVALRRAVATNGPLKIAALKLLCANAERLGLQKTLELYQRELMNAEAEIQNSV